jgi:hypothetical protein
MKNIVLNINSINERVIKNAPSMKGFMNNAARAKLVSRKNALIKAFDAHSVTREIEKGPDSTSNSSSTLGGKPNLFSFIGFESGSNPTSELRQFLMSYIDLYKTPPKIKGNSREVFFEYQVKIPSKAEIGAVTPLPFKTRSSNKSWALSIESGLWGLSHYLFGLFASSRSGTGLESKYKVRDTEFAPVPYLTKLLYDFQESLF